MRCRARNAPPGTHPRALFALYSLAALIPIGDALLFALPSVAAGLLWGWMRLRFGSLWPGVVTHVVADAAIMIAIGI